VRHLPFPGFPGTGHRQGFRSGIDRAGNWRSTSACGPLTPGASASPRAHPRARCPPP